MLNNAFAETGMSDGATLMPLMFGVIFLLTWLIIRSLTATFSTMLVIVTSSMTSFANVGVADANSPNIINTTSNFFIFLLF